MHPSRLVVDLFGSIDEVEVMGLMSSWCMRVLGSPVGRELFWVEGVGCVGGLELQDGRRVVVKVVRPDQPVARLSAVQEVQRVLVVDGFPAPVPLASPAALAHGLAFAEELQDVGMQPNGHLPEHRRELAAQLARLVGACAAAGPATWADLGLGRPAWADYSNDDLWPRSHRPDVDLTAPGEGSEPLDELARVSKRVLCAAGDAHWVIGHADWEAQNLRFVNGQLAMVYDWDSLVVERESVIVGLASAVFCSRSGPGLGDVPTEAEQDSFFAEYQHAAGRLFTAAEQTVAIAAAGRMFTAAEQTVAIAAASWVTAYNARFQFSTQRRPSEQGGKSHLDNAPAMLDRLRRRIQAGATAEQ